VEIQQGKQIRNGHGAPDVAGSKGSYFLNGELSDLLGLALQVSQCFFIHG
jgi:hypothetical protein